MKLETLKMAPDRAGRYWATFEDGTRLGLYRQTVEDFGLYPGMELSGQEYEKLLSAAGQMSAKMRAVRIVSATDISQQELEQRLVRKGEDPEQAKAAVEWMGSLGLVDDRAVARNLVRSAAAKGYGLARAKQTLYEKRIPKELWQEALEDYPDQQERIRSFLESRLDADSGEKEIKRAVDALIRRGHSYGDIKKALKELQVEQEALMEE